MMNNSTVIFKHRRNEILMPYALKAAFFVAISSVGLISLIGNTFVVVLFHRTQYLRTRTNYYITSMAVSDLLFIAADGALYTNSRLSVFGLSVSSFQCKLGKYVSLVSLTVSVENLVMVTVDRFIATVFPMKATLISARIRAVFVFLIWIIPLGVLAPYCYYSRRAENPDEIYLCSTDSGRQLLTSYSIMGFVLLYCAPLVIIIILNFHMMKSLRRTAPVAQENNRCNSIRRRKQNQRVTKVLISIMVLFFVCWTPYYVSTFLFEFDRKVLKGNTQELLYISCQYIFPFISTAVNPLILFTFSTKYRRALKDYLPFAFVQCPLCWSLKQGASKEDVELPDLQ